MSRPRVTDLPGVLGHELRNPLASAVTAISLLGEMVDPDDPRRSMVDRALLDLDRINRLIDGWLDVSRGGRIGARSRSARVDIDELLGEVARAHGATVVSEPVGVAIRGDRELLRRALDNLLENATQAGAGKLRLAAQPLGGEVSIHVEDDGPGIAEADVRRVFRPGWSGRGGTGLGLHAVAATLKAHGGDIRCVPLSRGTRFTMRLPASCPEPAAAV